MPELILERLLEIGDAEGNEYGTVRVWADRQAKTGQWEGWIEFVAPDGRVIATDRETTQPNLDAVRYWATGLEPVYLEGALERAQSRQEAPTE
jgi:hypothetical protein